jgi:hypothetical protein
MMLIEDFLDGVDVFSTNKSWNPWNGNFELLPGGDHMPRLHAGFVMQAILCGGNWCSSKGCGGEREQTFRWYLLSASWTSWKGSLSLSLCLCPCPVCVSLAGIVALPRSANWNHKEKGPSFQDFLISGREQLASEVHGRCVWNERKSKVRNKPNPHTFFVTSHMGANLETVSSRKFT